MQRHINHIFGRSLTDLWRKMELMLQEVPEGANLNTDTKAAHIVQDVWSIEEEWILDPERRAELSLVQCSDEDPEEGASP